MKKRLFSITLIVCLMLTVVGCGNAIPDMTDEQMTMVTEYAAAMLLKYDSDYEPMLLNDERLAEEEEIQSKIAQEAERRAAIEAEKAAKQEAEKAEAEKGSSQGESVEHIDPAAFMELEGVSVSCNGIEFQDTYPNDGDDLFFFVHASEGCKLAIVHLQIVNNSQEEKNVNIFDTNARFKISFNGGEYHSTMMTMLENDFSVYAGVLAPGSVADTVLMVDLKEEECNPVENLKLYIKYNGQTVKTEIYP